MGALNITTWAPTLLAIDFTHMEATVVVNVSWINHTCEWIKSTSSHIFSLTKIQMRSKRLSNYYLYVSKKHSWIGNVFNNILKFYLIIYRDDFVKHNVQLYLSGKHFMRILFEIIFSIISPQVNLNQCII